jgi:iron complex outermembrane recepter protein
MDLKTTVTRPFLHSAAALAVSGFALSAGAAGAQEEEKSGLLTGVETITVEATRRSQNSQTVPIPMTAISGEAYKRKFAQDLRDLTNSAPNIQLEPVGIFQSSASFFIRGQGTGDIESAADPKVSIFVDGVVQGRVSTSLGDLLDIEAIEILRGPQGTLFGRNTIAGAVLVRHNAPDMEEFGISGGVTVGDFGRLDVKGTVNVPIIKDKVAARVAFKSTNSDGYWHNEFNDEDRGASSRITILPSIKFTPNDNLDITLRGEYVRMRDDTAPGQSHHYCRDDPFNLFTGGSPDNDLVILTQTLYSMIVLGNDPVTAAASAAALCGQPIEGRPVSEEYTFINSEERGNLNDIDIWGITGEINYNIPDVGTLTYIGNFRHVTEDIIFLLDVAPHDLFAGERFQKHDQTSHELRFASEFSDTVDFVAGVYYFNQKYTMKQESWGLLFAPNIVLNAPDPTAITFSHPDTEGQGGWSNQKNEAWAIFADANVHITDKLTLIVGGRYTKETKDFLHCPVGAGDPSASFDGGVAGCSNVPAFVIDPTQPPGGSSLTPFWALTPAIGFDTSNGAAGSCSPVLDPDGAPITCNNLLNGDVSWTQFTPRAGLSYQINDDVMAFATWSRGWRSGGFNGRGGTASTIGPFGPESADNYEIGVKSNWLENRLQINLNAFYTKTKDFQSAFIRPSTGGGGQETITANLGSVTTKGIELEINAVPTEGLSIWTSVGLLDYKQSGFCSDGDGFFGSDADNPPDLPGPTSQELPPCGPPEQVFDAIGNFLGWLQPTDNSNLTAGNRAPKWNISAGFAYEFMVGNSGSLTISADWLYSAKTIVAGSRATEVSGPNGPGVQQFNGDFLSHYRASSNIFNASMTWRDIDDRYRVSVFGKNLTNDIYNQATTNVGGLLEIRVPSIRRHWGVEVTFDL